MAMKKSILLILLSCICIVSVAQNTVRKIEVVGSASKEVVPDELFLSLTMKEYELNKKKVSLEDSEIKLRKILSDLKIPAENLVVTNVYGYISYNADNKPGNYENRKTYRLKLNDTKKINSILSMLDQSALESMHLEELSHSNIKAFQKEVRIEALKAAKEKASYLLLSMNQQLGEVLEIQELDYSVYQPQPMYNLKSSAMMESSAVDQFATQNIKVEYKIRAVFEIK